MRRAEELEPVGGGGDHDSAAAAAAKKKSDHATTHASTGSATAHTQAGTTVAWGQDLPTQAHGITVLLKPNASGFMGGHTKKSKRVGV